VRILEDLLVVVDRARREAGLEQDLHPPVGILLLEGLLQLPGELRAVGHPVGVGGEALVIYELLAPDSFAQPRPEALVVRADVDVAVAGLERLVGGGKPVSGAEGLRDAPRGPELGALPDGERQGSLEERGVHVLPAPGLLAGNVSGEDSEGAEEASREVSDGDAALRGGASRLSGDAHHAGHALGDQVVAGTRGIGSGLPEAGDARVDDARVDLFERLVVYAELLGHAGAKVLDDHVRPADEAVEDLARPILLEVERHALLVAVYGGKGRGVLARHPEPHRSPGLV